MLANRAPTSLLRMLLDILNAMNRSSGIRDTRQGGRNRSSTFEFVSPPMDTSPALLSRKRAPHVEGNPTTNALQEIIELLASDISAERILKVGGGGSFVNLNEFESGISQQAAIRWVHDWPTSSCDCLIYWHIGVTIPNPDMGVTWQIVHE